MNGREFVSTFESLDTRGVDPAVLIRTAITNVLGEMPATVVLSYTGDGSNEDLQGFARRMEELLGGASSVMFTNIITWAKKNTRPAITKAERRS